MTRSPGVAPVFKFAQFFSNIGMGPESVALLYIEAETLCEVLARLSECPR